MISFPSSADALHPLPSILIPECPPVFIRRLRRRPGRFGSSAFGNPAWRGSGSGLPANRSPTTPDGLLYLRVFSFTIRGKVSYNLLYAVLERMPFIVNRRDFLKAAGLVGTTALAGCSGESARRLIPYILPPEDIIPGESVWYATTCRECPAGCGLLARNRDGHLVKVEGNPQHPVNRGRLCARGQASVQGLYNPDRLPGPMKREGKGQLKPVSWQEAERSFLESLAEIVRRGRGERIVFFTDLLSGSMKDLILLWLSEMGSRSLVQFEPLAYEPLRQANQIVFGAEGLPTYRLDRADFLISFGADFLETWISPVEYARQFSEYRAPARDGRKPFVYVGPRLSLTAAAADEWIAVPPGTEFLVALGMVRTALEEDWVPDMPGAQRTRLGEAVSAWSLDQISSRTGVPGRTIRRLAERFAGARRPLALACGLNTAGPSAKEAAVGANLLCTLRPGTKETIDLEGLSSLGEAAPGTEVKALTERIVAGEVALLLIYQANPVYSLPAAWPFLKGLQTVPRVVSFSSLLDETSRHAHLCLPTHNPFESWGDYTPRKGVWSLMQPVMGPVFDTRSLGDLLLSWGRALRDPRMFPWPDFYQLLRHKWALRGKRKAPAATGEHFWVEVLRRGGYWEDGDPAQTEALWKPSPISFPPPAPAAAVAGEGHLITYPTIPFFDGRSANRPFLQELPDPMTQITWGSWVEIHPETARSQGIRKGDLLRLTSPYGQLSAPAYPYPGLAPGVLAMPMGQGHSDYGRFASDHPGGPSLLLPAAPDPSSGGIPGSVQGVKIEKMGRQVKLAHTDGSSTQHGRGLARSVPLAQFMKEKETGRLPRLRLPLSEGDDRSENFYPSHRHPDYRWVMVVDLDRCTGCGACVAACYAENNVAVVGREQVLKGREMSWLRIERFWEADGSAVRFVPMLCQHCDHAPCESVCPMFAPHHSVDGLNNQVYNRCVGTFFCSQNCPYKVRRFNWFTFTRPEPLPWQLNPDVTVRQKGVMEKCSFCIQRIVEAKLRAAREGRKVRDGEVVPACSQTCPAGALVFGNLRDGRSRVSQLVKEPRAYQIFEELGTKPAVIYLKKILSPSGDA
jgi:anaerobic selenocysteine-containing dehydrogenase/Fe-S-cluster-containing dehydrogenase component